MGRKVIQHISLNRDSKSYINSLYAVLTSSGLFEGPKFLLSGMTGMAFKFTILQGISPISITAYGPWVRENWRAVNNLGIYNEARADRSRHRTFPLIQHNAIKEIKASIDNGRAVLYWCPPFGVIYGYDDEQKLFYYVEGEDRNFHGSKDRIAEKACLYDNVLLNHSSLWFYQLIGEKVEKEKKDIYRDSLLKAVFDWKGHKGQADASGKLAYPFVIDILKSGDFDSFGAAYTLHTYAQSKNEISHFMKEVVTEYKELTSSHKLFANVAQVYHQIDNLIDYQSRYSKISSEHFKPIVNYLQEAESIENQAMIEIESFLQERFPDWSNTMNRLTWLQGDAR